MLIRVLPWDSEHFGFRVGRADAPPLQAGDIVRAVSEAEQQRLRCLYLLADAQQVPTWRAAAREEPAGSSRAAGRVVQFTLAWA